MLRGCMYMSPPMFTRDKQWSDGGDMFKKENKKQTISLFKSVLNPTHETYWLFDAQM